MIISCWTFRNPEIYSVVNPLDMGVHGCIVRRSMPASSGGTQLRIFMGDVGALAIGRHWLLALTLNTHLLLILIWNQRC